MDRLAGRAWSEEHNHKTNQANATHFRHADSFQVITSNGSITGRVPKRLSEILMMERGMPALQKTTQMTDEAMRLIDLEATIQGEKKIGATMYSIAHWAKFYTHHWYMASRSHKFGLADSAECQCCREGAEETTSHIFQCPNRDEIHIDHRWKLTELMADQQITNGL